MNTQIQENYNKALNNINQKYEGELYNSKNSFDCILTHAVKLYNEQRELNISYNLIQDKSSIDHLAIYYIAEKILAHNPTIATNLEDNSISKVEILSEKICLKIQDVNVTAILAFEPHHDDFLGSASGLFFASPKTVQTTVYTLAKSDDARDDVDLTNLGEDLPTRRASSIIHHKKCNLMDYDYHARLENTKMDQEAYEQLISHYKKYYADKEQLKNVINDALIKFKTLNVKEKYIAIPIGLEHPMHVLTAHYCTKYAIEHELTFHIIFYVDHPYDFTSAHNNRISIVTKYYSERLKYELVRADDCSIDQSNLAGIIKQLYGDKHYGEFSGTLENSMCSYFLPINIIGKATKSFNLHVNNILYATAQAKPFFKTGGSGEVAFSYMKALRGFVNKSAVIMPKYKKIMKTLTQYYHVECVAEGQSTPITYSATGDILFSSSENHHSNINNENVIKLLDYNSAEKGFSIQFAESKKRCKLEKYEYAGIIYYLLDIEGCFESDDIFCSENTDADYAAFSLAVMRSLQNELDFMPTILHCNDHQTALIPFIRKIKYPNYIPDLKTVYTIHFYGYKGIYSKNKIFNILNINENKCDICFICERSKNCIFNLTNPYKQNDIDNLGIPDDKISFMKIGIQFADIVTTVSQGYAHQIKSYPDFLGINNIYGIRNGLEMTYHDLPNMINKSEKSQADVSYMYQDDSNYPEAKKHNKNAFQQQFGLTVDENIPMFCMVSRLNSIKGIEGIKHIFEKLMDLNLQLVIIGDDDKVVGRNGHVFAPYADFFAQKQQDFPTKFFYSKFSEDLEFKAYSASDVLIMPSIDEACGTTQIQSMKYGTLPIVSMLESFHDTIIDYNKTKECDDDDYLLKSPEDMNKGIGFFTFKDDCWVLLDMIKVICNKLNDPVEKNGKWRKAINSSVKVRFNWENRSIREYLNLYNGLL